MTMKPPLLAMLVAVALGPSAAAAISTTDPGSILVMPLVLVDEAVDTSIQITNMSNLLVHVRCHYVNAYHGCSVESSIVCEDDSNCPMGETCVGSWIQTGFDLVLTRQQPTYWVVSSGRAVDPYAPRPCQPAEFGDPGSEVVQCYGAGLDPGVIPPVTPPFHGELVCVQVAADGTPVSQNGLAGVVGIERLASPSIDKYNALAIQGLENDGDSTLELDGVEYEACPAVWSIDRDGDSRPPLFVVPCSHDFAGATPSTVALDVVQVDEFEQTMTTTLSVTGWEMVWRRMPSRPSPNLTHERWSSSTPGAGVLVVGHDRPGDAFNPHFLGLIEPSLDDITLTP